MRGECLQRARPKTDQQSCRRSGYLPREKAARKALEKVISVSGDGGFSVFGDGTGNSRSSEIQPCAPPVIVGVSVDYRDNHRLMENVHPDALN